MKNRTILRGACAPLALTIALAASPAFAQDAPAQTQEDDLDFGEAIIVTGSRIASPQVTSESPLQVIGDQQIDDSGATNIQEVLLRNPTFGTPALSRTNSAFLTAGTGVATVDLRDLGTDRTLVLINGRRVVSSLSGSSGVDLNTIPTQFIERIDTLTGGASSLYGSDAVAGVVNFVLKDDFEGLEANAQYGITELGDDERYQLNVTAGTNFAEDRGNIMVHFGYSNEGGVLSRERRNTYFDDSDTSVLTGNLDDWGTATEPFYSGFAPQGSFTLGDIPGTFRRNDAGLFVDGDDMVLDIQDPTNPDFGGIAVNESRTYTYGADGTLRPCFSTNGGTGGANEPFPAAKEIRVAARLPASPSALTASIASSTARSQCRSNATCSLPRVIMKSPTA